jgi:uncharacterized protein involved in type VI secretion and phage assembly
MHGSDRPARRRWQPPKPFTGAHTAVVVGNVDPLQEGRVQVAAPSLLRATTPWARLATLMAGPDRGTWFVPDVGDEVLVVFEGGDPARPIVIGSLWGSGAAAPEANTPGNGVRSITTRSGARVAIDDTGGGCTIELRTPGGRRVSLDDTGASLTIDSGDGSTIVFDAGGVEVTSAGTVKVSASNVRVAASSVAVDAGIVTAAGVVQCETLIATSVIAASYTPGAGNIW